MSVEIDSLYYKVRLEMDGLKLDLKKMKGSLQGATGDVAKEGGKMSDIFKKVGKAIATAFVFVGITAFLKKLAMTRGEFEQLGVAFETMLGSKERADRLMTEVVELAAKTPFTLKEVASGAKSLLAYGYAAEEVVPAVKALGDIGSGLNIAMKDMTYLFGTSRTQGRLFSKDMMQMAGRGIPIYTELGKVFNTDAAGVTKLVQAGKVGFPELEKMVKNLTSEGGMFFNLMEKQSLTLTGLTSNMADAWDRLLDNLGQGGIGTAMKNVITGMTSLIDGFRQAFGTKQSNLLEDERIKLNHLVGAITSVNIGTKTRASLMEELRTGYPEFLKGLNAEKTTNEELLTALEGVNKAYLAKIAIEANKEEIADNEARATKLQKEMNNLSIQIDKFYKFKYGDAAKEQLTLQEKLFEISKTSETRVIGMRAVTESNALIASTWLGNWNNLQGKQNELQEEYNALIIKRVSLDPNFGKKTDIVTDGPVKGFDPEEIKKDLAAAKASYDNYTDMVKAGMKGIADDVYKEFLKKNGTDYKSHLESELERTKEYAEARLVVLTAYTEEVLRLGSLVQKDIKVDDKIFESIMKEFDSYLKEEDSNRESRDEKDKERIASERSAKLQIIKDTKKGYVAEIEYIKKKIALEELYGYIGSEKWKKLKGDLFDMEDIARDVLVDAFFAISSIAGDISNSLQKSNKSGAELMGKLSTAAGGVGSLLKSLGSQDYIGAAVGAISMILTLMEDSDQNRIDMAQVLSDQLDRQADALERQLALLDAIEGTARLEGMQTGLTAINKDLKSVIDDLLKLNPKSGSGRRDNSSLSSGMIGIKIDFDSLDQEKIDSLIKVQNDLISAAQIMGADIDILDSQLDYLLEIDRLYKLQQEHIAKINEELTGSTAANITDEIVNGFKNGEHAVEDFAKTTEDLIKNALIQGFKAKFLDSQMQEFYKSFAADVESNGGLSDSEIKDNQDKLAVIINAANLGWEEYQKLLDNAGYQSALSEGSSLSGSIKGITENTASVLAGQMMGLRIDVSQSLNVANLALDSLNEIALNTRTLFEIRDALVGIPVIPTIIQQPEVVVERATGRTRETTIRTVG